jgi:hypothetical protein
MQRILIVSPDGWMDAAAQAFDRARFAIMVAEYSNALRLWRDAVPATVIIGATAIFERPYSL